MVPVFPVEITHRGLQCAPLDHPQQSEDFYGVRVQKIEPKSSLNFGSNSGLLPRTGSRNRAQISGRAKSCRMQWSDPKLNGCLLTFEQNSLVVLMFGALTAYLKDLFEV